MPSTRHERVVDHLGLDAAVRRHLVEGELRQGDDRAAVLVVGADHALEHGGAAVHDVVAQHDHERVVADVLAGHGHRVAQAERLALAHVVDVGHLGQRLDLAELVHLAPLLQVVLELEVAVEVVLEAALAAAGDDEDVLDARPHRLLDHVLDGRLVDDRQHLLGLGLGGGQEPGAETCRRDDRLRDARAHAVTIRRCGRPRTTATRTPPSGAPGRPDGRPASRPTTPGMLALFAHEC